MRTYAHMHTYINAQINISVPESSTTNPTATDSNAFFLSHSFTVRGKLDNPNPTY